jgi:beta-glucosidase
VTRPLKELKGFAKILLQPGEQQNVSVRLDRRAFAFYDPDKNGWVAEKNDYKILVGGSSRDLALQGNYHLAETVFDKD